MSGLIQQHITQKYIELVGRSQFGAVPKIGTSMASHLIRSFIDYTRIACLCMFILFVDLSKAFDKIIREPAMGCPHGANNDVTASVQSLGHSHTFATNIARLVRDHGTVLEQMGIDGKVRGSEWGTRLILLWLGVEGGRGVGWGRLCLI